MKLPGAVRLLSALLIVLLSCGGICGDQDDGGVAPFKKDDRTGPSPASEIIKGIDLLYNSRFDEAESLFQSLMNAHPGHPGVRFYIAMVAWARLSSGFWDPATVEQFRQRIDLAIESGKERIETRPNDPEAHFFLGGALGCKGRFELMREKWFASFLLASDAVEHLKTCLRLDPANKDALLGLGIYEYYTARMSGIVRFLSRLLIRKSDRKAGLAKLHAAAREGLYSSSEAKGTLLHIYMFMEQDYDKALPIAAELAERYPETARYYYLKGVCHAAVGNEDGLKDVLSAMESKRLSASGRLSSLVWERMGLYLSATKAMMEDRLEDAERILSAVMRLADPQNDPAMIAWPLLKSAMIMDLRMKREAAVALYGRLLEMENGSGAQFLAKRYLAEPVMKKDPFIAY